VKEGQKEERTEGRKTREDVKEIYEGGAEGRKNGKKEDRTEGEGGREGII
jgi:hypothetical protein